jgi:hypothetical protein
MPPGATIVRLLGDYMARYHLARVAYLTNSQPSKEDASELIGCFNYVCFCVRDYPLKIEFLFLAYLCGYRKVAYDVVVSSIEQCLLRRQFGYIYLLVDSDSQALTLFNYIKKHKPEINRTYPIIVRLRRKDGKSIATKALPVIATLSEADILYEVS